MATRKKPAETEEMIETDAPDIDTEDQAPETGKLAEENNDLKAQLASMQKIMQQMQEQMQKQQELMQQMASGKKVTPPRPLSQAEIDAQNVQKIAAEAAEAGTDPWTVDVEVFVPHRDPGEDKWYWININDRSAQIPANDSRQKMKLPFALILTDTLKAKRREEDYQDGVQVFDPKTNPHENGL